MLPLPPLSRFPLGRVYAGHNFFPLADQFLLVPRQFAQAVFGAVRLCYDCKALQAQSESGVPAQTESLLRKVLLGEDGSDVEVPFGYYEFPVVIVRNKEGGVCEVLHQHKLACEMLRGSGLAAHPIVALTEDVDGKLASFGCMALMRRWHKQACVEMFPPFDLGTGSNPVAVGRGGDGTGVNSRNSDDGRRVDGEQRELSRGAAMTFEEATGRVEGIHGDLRELLGMMRVDVAPAQGRWSYFLAHHYPFHRANPLHPAERGPLDEVAVIEGYRLSRADFNKLALAFSCFLFDTIAALAERDHRGRGTSEPPRPGGAAVGGQEDVLVLRTTAAAEEGLQALVNCSLVESLHDVWALLLENKFEPPETVCHGPVGPCVERALLAETHDL